MIESTFIQDVLAEVVAGILFSLLGLMFARPIEKAFRRRLSRYYLLPRDAIPNVIIDDETPRGGSNVRKLVLRNEGSIAVSDFRAFKCMFDTDCSSLSIVPLSEEVSIFNLDPSTGARGEILDIAYESLEVGGDNQCRLLIEMTDDKGIGYRMTSHILDNSGLSSYPSTCVVKHRLPFRRIEACCHKRVLKLQKKYSLDLSCG